MNFKLAAIYEKGQKGRLSCKLNCYTGILCVTCLISKKEKSCALSGTKIVFILMLLLLKT